MPKGAGGVVADQIGRVLAAEVELEEVVLLLPRVAGQRVLVHVNRHFQNVQTSKEPYARIIFRSTVARLELRESNLGDMETLCKNPRQPQEKLETVSMTTNTVELFTTFTLLEPLQSYKKLTTCNNYMSQVVLITKSHKEND